MKSLLSNAVRSSAVRVRPGGLAISQSRKITVKEMPGARAVGGGGVGGFQSLRNPETPRCCRGLPTKRVKFGALAGFRNKEAGN